MRILSLFALNLRGFKEKHLAFTPGINLISGRNGAGKTTILEALYVLMTGRSFRASHLNELKCESGNHFLIEARFEKKTIEQKLLFSLKEKDKQILYNSTPMTQAAGLLGILHGTLLAPHDIELVKGAPALRRQYLDLQIAQVDPLYVHHLMRYYQALKQRNHLLRKKQMSTLSVFDEPMALSAAYIIASREKAAEELKKNVQALYEKISATQDVASISYQSTAGSHLPEEILKKMHANRAKELHLGYTCSGPHRDDLNLEINGKLARLYASEGEGRTLAAALRLSEWQRIKMLTDTEPLLLVDDFGISLDEARMRNLADLFASHGQVLITMAAPRHPFGELHTHTISLV